MAGFNGGHVTSDKSVSDTTLKDMLISLRTSFHADMMQYISNFKAEVGEMGGRLDHIEKKIGDYSSAYNTLVDAYNDQSDDINWLKYKMANLEDRSRRNNVNIWGVPEAVLPAQLQ